MTDLGPYTLEDFEDLQKRVAELERKINLLADRVLHYYNNTTPEIDKLERKILILEQEIAALWDVLRQIPLNNLSGRGAIIRQKLREIERGGDE